jgi:endo-1,4-beta-xylanase
MVTRYKSKVKQWDVVNEALSPSGALRTSANSSDVSDKTAKDIFFWGDYLGRNFPLNAFKYARAADATAQLFINEYGLEASAAKTDSLVNLIKELKGKGAQIDGVGTQVHALWNSSYGLIDSMFIKLAGTGLLVRISEMDIRINPLFKSGFVLTDLESSYQADMYNYIIKSYIKYVPKAQQAGITIWGLTDNTSWLYKSGADFPLLFNTNYSRKKAYAGVLNALKGL